MGQSVSTELRLVNSTHCAISGTRVSGTDNYDWGSGERPDNNFQEVRIPSGSSAQRRADLNARASNCPFNMTLTFDNGTKDTFRIFQKFAAGQRNSGFQHTERNHEISYRREGGNTLVIEVKDTQDTIQNLQAEQLNKEAQALQQQGKLAEAAAKIEQALAKAKQSQTVSNIRSNKANCQQLIDSDRRAEQLQKEAQALQQQGKLAEAVDKLEQALGLAKQSQTVASIKQEKTACQQQQQQAEQLGREGLALLAAGQLEQALAQLQLAAAGDAAQLLAAADAAAEPGEAVRLLAEAAAALSGSAAQLAAQLAEKARMAQLEQALCGAQLEQGAGRRAELADEADEAMTDKTEFVEVRSVNHVYARGRYFRDPDVEK